MSGITRRMAWQGVAAGLLASLAVDGGHSLLRAAAQDATPPSVESLPPGAVGVTIEPLIDGLVSAAPGYSLRLLHFVFAPGATIAPHHHAGAQAAWVASGAVGYTLLEGTKVEVHRAPSNGTPGPVEPLAPGVEVVLHAGDAYFEDRVLHWARNAGATPADLYVAALYKADEPATTFTNEQGTPVP